MLWKFKFENVNVICLPMERRRAQENSLKRLRAFQIQLEFGNVGFEERGIMEYLEKPLGAE